jgi:hypothetical protein
MRGGRPVSLWEACWPPVLQQHAFVRDPLPTTPRASASDPAAGRPVLIRMAMENLLVTPALTNTESIVPSAPLEPPQWLRGSVGFFPSGAERHIE